MCYNWCEENMKRAEYFDGIRIKNFKNDKTLNKPKKSSLFSEVDFKKSLGQNFISDKNLLNSIANIAGINNNDCVLEIGAGAGTLTDVLADKSKQVISYEIDKSLKPILEKLETKHSNLEIRFEDFMQANIENIFQDSYKVVANIPYYITTPIIFKLLEYKTDISEMLFMVQKEVAERFSSIEGSKMYGITSVILQSIADVSYEKTVKKECFTPHPKVDSALVKIVFRNKYNLENFEKFKSFIHASFAMRRKTLINNLTTKLNLDKEKIRTILINLNMDFNVRPEDIKVEDFIKIFNLLKIEK